MSDGDVDVKPPTKKAAPAKAKPKAKAEPMILDDSDDDESMCLILTVFGADR